MSSITLKTFREFVDEAVETGIASGGSRALEWSKVIKSKEFLTLVVSSDGVNMYRYGSNIYYLTTIDNDYLGHIEVKDGKIGNSFSNMKGGFYTKIFKLLLSYTSMHELLSDVRLSTNAIKAYINLDKNIFDVMVKTPQGYIEFNKVNLLDNYANRISIKLIKE
jgi:hypothetical protein